MRKEKWTWFQNGKKRLTQIRHAKDDAQMDSFYSEQSSHYDDSWEIIREKLPLF